MSKFIESLVELLNKEGIYPISKPSWESFEINHTEPIDEESKIATFKYIKEHTRGNGGIYIYEKDGVVIYVGKAKSLLVRLKSHYTESFQPVPGDTKDQRWHRFFSSHRGALTVFWKEFSEENERQIIELLLTKLISPVFLKFK